jgi:hypothetical protein
LIGGIVIANFIGFKATRIVGGIILNVFIADCQAIAKIIPLDQNQVAGAAEEELN